MLFMPRSVVLLMWRCAYCSFANQAAAAVSNWCSKIGKTGVKTVHDVVTNSDDVSTIEAHAEWVQNRLLDSNFVYENDEDLTGAHRGELMLRTFAAHLQVVNKSNVFYWHPVGGFGHLQVLGQQLRGANGIKKLSDQKWAKITEGDESEDHRGLIQISDDHICIII
ncbi:hypothetical protein B0H14DRAFT_2621073 [Mycena olivaceomarginata]|nr:hypothetical protein B0H14DRAFT_2621073 [Mycena olivaceomarginata]